MRCQTDMSLSAIALRPEYKDLAAFMKRIEEAYAVDPQWEDMSQNKDPFCCREVYGAKLWYRITKDDDKPPTLVIPNDRGIKDMILREFHEPKTIGHREGAEGYRKMALSYWWGEMKAEALAWAERCTVCARSKRAGKGLGEMAELPHLPTRPWDSVALDFCGPFQTGTTKSLDKKAKWSKSQRAEWAKSKTTDASRRKSKSKLTITDLSDTETVNVTPNSVLVAVCRLTKMVHLIPCRDDMTAEQMADLFVDEIVR